MGPGIGLRQKCGVVVMAFDNLADFLAMGGHGFYVWLAYGVSLVALDYLLLSPLSKRRALLKEIQQRIRLEQAQQDSTTGEV